MRIAAPRTTKYSIHPSQPLRAVALIFLCLFVVGSPSTSSATSPAKPAKTAKNTKKSKKAGEAKRLTWPEYIKRLASTDPEVRKVALLALVKHGPDATFALVHGIASKDMAVRVSATKRVQEFKEKAIPGLIKAVSAKRGKVRSIALRMLWLLGKKASAAIPAFILALDDSHFHVQGVAAGCLGRFGVKSAGAVDKLFKTIAHPNKFTKRHATDALSRILISMGVLDPRLVTLLSHKDPQMRAGVAMTLQQMGKFGAFALTALRKALRDPIAIVRMQAAGAIGSFRALGAPAIPDLRKAVHDKSQYVRWFAAAALGGIGAASYVAMPDLMQGLLDPYPQVRIASAAALGNFGARALPALPALCKALEHKDRHLVIYAAEAIGSIGPSAKSAIPDLQRLLGSKWHDVKMSARRALRKLKPPPPHRAPARR